MHKARAGGFTLVELLVAITIMAIVAVLGWRGLDSIVRARIGITADMEQTRGIQLTFAQLENDCAHLADSAMLSGHERMAAAGANLLLVRQVAEENQPVRVQVVAYRLVDGVLSRRESAPTRELNLIEADWQSMLSGADKFPPIALQEGVAAFNLRTWSAGENGWRVAGSDGAQPGPFVPGVATGQKIGLEVALQLQGQSSNMTKILLLGAV